MTSPLLWLLMFVTLTTFLNTVEVQASLEMCYKCSGGEASDCVKDHDFCDGHDRCLKMEYKGPNGGLVYDAMCHRQVDCDTADGKIALCDKKDKCKVNTCCKGNLCNSPASRIWLNTTLMFGLLVVAVVLLRR